MICQDDGFKVLHDHQKGRDFRAQIRAEQRQEGKEERGRQEGELFLSLSSTFHNTDVYLGDSFHDRG